MKPKILELDRDEDASADQVVALIGAAVGHQMTPREFDTIQSHLSGEDYTIAERFFPALQHLVRIVECQEDPLLRNDIVLKLAVMCRYAVWEPFDPTDQSIEIQAAMKDACRLFLDSYLNFSDVEGVLHTNDVDRRRYLLTAIAALWGDAELAKVLHDIASEA